jgi:hypothetical protein
MRLAAPLALLAAFTACVLPGARRGTGAATDVECAIHGAAIDSIFAGRGARRIVLVDSTMDGISRSERVPAFWRELASATGGDSVMIARFEERNAHPVPVCPSIDAGIDVTRVSDAELQSLPGRDAEAYWTAFRAKYPDAIGSVTLSRPGLSADGSRAILEVTHTCGSLCGEGMLILLRRDGERWRVVSKRTTWVS